MARAVDLGTEEIVRTLKSDEAKKAYEENGVLAAYLYGSAAEGSLGVGVAFAESVAQPRYAAHVARVQARLKALLNTDDPQVVCVEEDSPELAFAVLRQPVVLYKADQHEAAELEIKLIGIYYDWVEHCRVMSTFARGAEHADR